MPITKSIEVIPTDPELFQRRRVQIAVAALSVFSKQGFHKTTVREIAREAGASVGTLYEYFRSKEDILHVACEQNHRELEDELLEAVSRCGHPLDKLKAGIDQYYRILARQTDTVLLIYREPQSINKEGRQTLMHREECLRGIFETILTDGVEQGVFQVADVKLISHNIISLGHMWGLKRWALHKHFEIDRFIQLETDFIVSAITPYQIEA